ncbi:MAG TPA: CusA/CzcA family heavy metal efflux RND transporter [Bacteroidetes bacterium]|nr:CusA/CzcA family heavy metal efflux RND transporter [Bacteroidota bacterium]HCN37663.1 CusA/CzcA family heavy metal efflux RND transporter [Bacteroidota bacterium]
MLNKILGFSLKNRILIIIISVLLLAFGTYTALNMEVDVFPDLTAPTVVVLTEAHGMAPEEVEQLVTFKIETSVNGATDVRRVRSSSSAGFSIVWIEFNWGTDIYQARQIVAEKIATISEQMSEGVGNPVLAPQSSIMGEIMYISVTGKNVNLMDLRTISDWTIRPSLLAVGGVSQVTVIGGEYKQYQIQASPQKMSYYNVSLSELTETSKNINQNASGGFLNEYYQEYIIRGIGRISEIDQMGNSVIKVVNGAPVKLLDVAEIKIGSSVKIGDASVNGEPAVILAIQKQPSVNTLELTEKIDQSLSDISKNLPNDVLINSHIFRQADFIKASINNITKTLIEGSVFVVIILIVFLMNVRATVISLIAIPISLVSSILTLELLGFTINTMSLGGMAIAIGALVDDAIIDVENVFKRLKENSLKRKEDQKGNLEVIYNASIEVRPSVVNATFIIIAAFLPLFFLTGMEGRLLVPLGIAFIVSLFASLVVAITLTPVLCSYLLTNERVLAKHSHGENKFTVFLIKYYKILLERSLNHRKAILVSVSILFIGSLTVFSTLGRSFLPEFNEGSLVISAVTLPGTSLEESNKIGIVMENLLLTVPEVKSTARRTGRAELDEHTQGVNSSEIEVPFILNGRSRDEFFDDVRDKLSLVSGVSVTIGQPIGHRIDHMLSGTRANIAIKLYGNDLAEIYKTANQIKDVITPVNGLVDISVEQQVEIPQIQIKPKRELLAQYGIPMKDFTEFIDVAFSGEVVSQVFEGNRSFDLVLRLDDPKQNNILNIKNILIDTYNGQKIPLYYVADIISTSGPSTINRENVQRKIVISANVSGKDQRSVVNEIQEKINNRIRLPEGYRVEYGGQFEAEEEASGRILLMSFFSLLIIFVLLYQEFKNFKIASIILINLPLALIGGVFAVFITSGIISIPSLIGFITLFGIATRNGILLVSRFNALKLEGVGLYDRIVKGSLDRLNPILMTALATGLSLIPLAIAGDAPGNEIQSPMAKVILGGLLTSTFLNLIVVPVVYYFTNQNSEQK